MFDAHLPASFPWHSIFASSAMKATSPAYVPRSQPNTLAGNLQVPSVTVLERAKLE